MIKSDLLTYVSLTLVLYVSFCTSFSSFFVIYNKTVFVYGVVKHFMSLSVRYFLNFKKNSFLNCNKEKPCCNVTKWYIILLRHHLEYNKYIAWCFKRILVFFKVSPFSLIPEVLWILWNWFFEWDNSWLMAFVKQ